MGVKKIVTMMLALGTAITPISVYADEEPTSEPTPTAETQDETTENADDTNTQVEVTAEGESNVVIDEQGTEAEKTEEKAEETESILDQKANELAKGDKDRASLFKQGAEAIKKNLEDNPHFQIWVAGNGYVEVTDKNENVTTYANGMMLSKVDKDGEDILSDDEYKEVTENVKKNHFSLITVYGEDGEEFHVKVVPEEEETVYRAEHFLSTSETGEGELIDLMKDKTEEEKKGVLEYDVVTKASQYDRHSLTFTVNKSLYYDSAKIVKERKIEEKGGATLSKNANGMLKAISAPLAKIASYAATSGGGDVHIDYGINTENPGCYGDYWNDTFYIGSASDGTLNSYIQEYRANNGGSLPGGHCYDPHACAPANGSNISVSWSTETLGNGGVRVHWDAYGQYDATDMYGPGFYGPTQRFSGSFDLPPRYHNVTVNLTKTSNASKLLEVYPTHFSVEGAVYGLYWNKNDAAPFAKLTTNRRGKVSYEIKDLSYSTSKIYMRELVAPKGHELSQEVYELNVTGDQTDYTMTEATTPQDIKFTKKDDEGALVGGATILLENNDTNVTYTINTNNKTVYTNNVQAGHYTATETVVPEGYYPAKPVNFEVKPSVTETQSFEMTDIPVKYGVLKVDKADPATTLEGVVLQLLNENGSPLEQWITTNEVHQLGTGELLSGWNGKLKCGGTYYIHEVSTVEGYEKLLDDVKIRIPEEAPDKHSADYEKYGMPVVKVGNMGFGYQVVKKDAETGEQVIGATLQLYDGEFSKDKTPIAEWVTNGQSYAIPKKLLKLNQRYTIHESKAPDGYYRTGTDVSFIVENSGGQTQTIYVKDYKVKYAIKKTDGETSDAISGVKLAVYDTTTNKKVDEWTTDGNAHSLTGKLTGGHTYEVRELATVKGYYLDKEAKTFTVPEVLDNSNYAFVKEINFTNKPIKVWVGKRDGNDKNKSFLAGAKMAIKDSAGNTIYTFTSTGDGRTRVPNKLLEAGKKYYLTELEAPEGYYLAFTEDGKDKIEFSIPSSWQDVVNKGMITSGVSLDAFDYKIKHEFNKVDELGNGVVGAHLGLFNSSNTQLEDWITDGKAHAFTTTLKAGQKYMVKELQVVTGYYKAENVSFTVETTPDAKNINSVMKGKTITQKMVDYHISWRISKTDKKGDVLKNVDGTPFVFQVFDTNGTVNNPDDDSLIATLSTAEPKYQANGYWELSDVLDGNKTYRVHEASCPNGYSLADDTFQFITQLRATNADGTTKVPLTKVVDDSYEVKFKKVDSDSNKLVSYLNGQTEKNTYFAFNVYDNADPSKVAFTFTTENYEKDGWVDISSKCIAGHTYTVKEIDYPYGYYKARDFTFTCPKQGKVEITMTDPTIKARFRKLDEKGNVLSGNFKFSVIDTATNQSVAMLDLKEADAQGYVHFGKSLKENTTYKIVETEAENGYEMAGGYVKFTTPSYYTGENQVKNSCIVRNGDTTEACTTWEEINK